ncbi:MAG: LCP family protein [Treponema sp.]|nr:LCP family protein [Treponema sp.]
MKLFKLDASKLLLALIILIFFLGIFFAVYAFRSNPLEEALSTNRVVNILYVIEDDKVPLSAYVLMYNPPTNRAAIWHIPGQIGQRIARTNRVDRIDSIYDSSRIGNFQSEVERLLGIDINFSMVITKENLVSIVDLLEGVEIFIPSAVSYRNDDTLILFPSGMTVLDGDKAGIYATYSLPYEDDELKTFRRQRFFLSFLSRQIQMNDSLKNKDVSKLYSSFFRSNMNRRTTRLLFEEFVNIDIGRTNILSVAGDLREVSGQMLIIPLHDGNIVKDVVRQTMAALTRDIDDYRERRLTVEILNGTAITGRASRTAEILRSFGYDVVAVGNAERNDYESTVIIHRSGDESLVKDFGDSIRCTNIRREFDDEIADTQSRDAKANITLIIGRNFDGRYVTGN